MKKLLLVTATFISIGCDNSYNTPVISAKSDKVITNNKQFYVDIFTDPDTGVRYLIVRPLSYSGIAVTRMD